MKVYLISLAVGVLVGAIYGLLNVRSPAPPIVALVGLFGILMGEQIVPVGKQLMTGSAVKTAILHSENIAHLFGSLPGHNAAGSKTAAVSEDVTP